MENIDLYNYYLPNNFIAQTPLKNRSDSKLFVLNKKNNFYEHKIIKDLPEILGENDVLVFNKSKVINARIIGDFGEILLSKPLRYENVWECLVKPGKKFKFGKIHDLADGLKAKVVSLNKDGTRNICFLGIKSSNHFDQWLQKNGTVPLPHYIKEKLDDHNRYQTIYAKEGKSVAAPTAGLHFTEDLISKLHSKGLETYYVHLDVGLGTFLPVKTKDIKDHKMHSEYFELDIKTAKNLNYAKAKGKRIIAVGTTSIRVLESCCNNKGLLEAQRGDTDIFIYPGYKFKFIDSMITNFHLPKSTLLMLVSAFAGREKIICAYEEAIKKGYRFFSFGDAMFIQ